MMNLEVGVARERGLETKIGAVLADNDAMLVLCKRLGFEIGDAGETNVRRVSLSLARPASKRGGIPVETEIPKHSNVNDNDLGVRLSPG